MAATSYDKHKTQRAIHAARANTLGLVVDHMRSLDAAEDWAAIVTAARDAGLPKETFLQEFSCAWSTVTRWMAGQTLPGPFARDAVKAKLVELVSDLRDHEIACSKSAATEKRRAALVRV